METKNMFVVIMVMVVIMSGLVGYYTEVVSGNRLFGTLVFFFTLFAGWIVGIIALSNE